MAKATDKKVLKKGKATFFLIGKTKVTDKTFNLENTYDSKWTDNSMYIGINCGKGNVVYAEMRGGFFPDQETVIRAYDKTEKDDAGKSKSVEIAWEDRFDESLLDTVADSSLITVGIEKDVKDKTLYKKFLTAYDAIEYLSGYLEDDVVVNIKGNIRYSEYDGNVSIKKEITSIVLSKVEEQYEKIHEKEEKELAKMLEDNPNASINFTELEDFFKATFSQTILIDSKGLGKKDEEKGTMTLDAYVVDYVGNPKINGKKVEIKKNIAYPRTFEIAINTENPTITAKMLQKFFKTKKKGSLNEITVIGDLIEGTAIVNITDDDIPDDIKELIEMGLYSREEAEKKCAVGNNNREKRMIIIKPDITYVGQGADKKPTVAFEEAKYDETDLVFYEQALNEAGVDTEEPNNNSGSDNESSDDDDDLLNMLENM